MSATFSLERKNAVVTGLSTGIGRAIAEALAREGANVAGDYQKDAEGAAVTQGLVEAHGREALIVQGSTADEAHVNELADQVVARCQDLSAPSGRPREQHRARRQVVEARGQLADQYIARVGAFGISRHHEAIR